MPASTLLPVDQNSSVTVAPTLSDLPTELILHILQDLDNESLIQLSLTCRNLHSVSLHLFFSRTDISLDPSRGWLLVTDNPPVPPQTLRALRNALYLQNLKEIYFSFTPDFRRIFRDMSDLRGLVARLPSIQTVCLQFRSVDNWAYHLLSSRTHCIEAYGWKKHLTGLLDIILDRSCVELHIKGMKYLSQLYIVSESDVTQPKQEGPGSRQGHLQEASTSGIVDTSSQDTKKVSRVLPIKSFFRKILSHSPFLDTKRSNTPPSRRSLLSDDAPNRYDLPPDYTKVPLDAPNDTLEVDGRQSFTPLCLMPKEFHFSDANMLFEPPLYDWTISTLKVESLNITALSFQSLQLPTTVWAKMLRSLTLPYLKKFEIYSTRLSIKVDTAFVEINNFLVRHPGITDLHLHTVQLSPPSTSLVKPPVLPLLSNFTAHPFYVNWMLQNSASEQHAFQKLDSITISAEYCHSRFDYNLFDWALKTVAGTRSTVLTLQFISNPSGVERWFTKHVNLGIEKSALSGLMNIASLVISLFFNVELGENILTLLPAWLHLFPKLDHVEFTKLSQGTMHRLKDKQFIGRLTLACPNMKTLLVQGEEFNLDSIRHTHQ